MSELFRELPRVGDKVIYSGASQIQINWGSCDDPRELLVVGNEYEIADVEVHSWHTKVEIVGIEGQFNSVCFDIIRELEEHDHDSNLD